MIRRIISVFLLLTILVGTTPIASANTNRATREQQCSDATQRFIWSFSEFLIGNILIGGTFLALDQAISVAQESEVSVTAGAVVAGVTKTWGVGALLEPLDQTVDFIRETWLEWLILATLSSFFNLFAGLFIDAGIMLNLTLNAGNPLISYGGRIILQIVNLGLVMSIIFIGIATILRLKRGDFSADKLLIKLIIGILFVNITIPAVTSIANIGTIVTDVMYKNSAPCPGSITYQFTTWKLATRIEDLLKGTTEKNIDTPYLDIVPDSIHGLPSNHQLAIIETEETQRMAFRGVLGDFFAAIIGLIAGTAMSFIAALTFLAFAIFIFIRFAVLMLLITFSPLIWLGFIFSDFKIPGLGSVWSGWWSQFLKWTFFGPVIVLFIAFTSQYLYSIEANPIVISGDYGFLARHTIQIVQLFIVIIISAIGIYASYKFSGAAGGMVTKLASGGLGLVANTGQKMLKAQQLKAEKGAKEAALKGDTKKEQAFKTRAKWANAASIGAGLNKSASLIAKTGIKPTIQKPDEEKINQKITEAIVKGLAKNPRRALALSKKEVEALSSDYKKAFVAALREIQKISSSLTSKENASLRQHEKTFASDLATATMKDVNAPSTLAFGKAMNPSDLSKAKNMLQLGQESMRDIVNNGTTNIIEDGVKTILALENELMANPTSFSKAEIGRLQLLRRNFDEKITDYILDSVVDPATTSPDQLKSILNLSNKNLSYISKSGTDTDKKKIDEALAHLGRHVATPTERAELTRIGAKVGVLQGKNEWLL